MYVKKFTSFCRVLLHTKEKSTFAHKRKFGLFFQPHGVVELVHGFPFPNQGESPSQLEGNSLWGNLVVLGGIATTDWQIQTLGILNF